MGKLKIKYLTAHRLIRALEGGLSLRNESLSFKNKIHLAKAEVMIFSHMYSVENISRAVLSVFTGIRQDVVRSRL